MRFHKGGIEVVACAEIDSESAKQIGRACCALGRISPEGSIDFTGQPYLIPLFKSGFLRDYVLSTHVEPTSLEPVLTLEREFDGNGLEPSFYTELGVEGFEAADHTDLRLNLTDRTDFVVYREDVLRALLDIFGQPPVEIDSFSHYRFNTPQIRLGNVQPHLFYGEQYFPPLRSSLRNSRDSVVVDFEDVVDEHHVSQLSEVYRSAANPNDILPWNVSLAGVSLLVQDTSNERNRHEETKLTRSFKPSTVRDVLADDRRQVFNEGELSPIIEEQEYV